MCWNWAESVSQEKRMNKTAPLATGFVDLRLVGSLQAQTPANPNVAEAKASVMEFFA
jgi:hypothetical protein